MPAPSASGAASAGSPPPSGRCWAARSSPGIGWRAVFWVNMPVVALACWLTLRYNPNPSPSHRRRLDLPGQALAIAALCCITYAVIEGSEHSWNSTRLAVLVAGAVAVLLFLAVEHRSTEPMLPLRLFRNRSFSIASIVGLALNLGFYGQFFVLTLYFQHYRGDRPFIAGLSLAPQASRCGHRIAAWRPGHCPPRALR